MEGLPALGVWAIIVFSACTGSAVYTLLRKTNGWRTGAASFVCGSAISTVCTLYVSDLMGFDKLQQHMVVALGLGLLGMTFARAVLFIAETQTVQIATRAIQRALGISETPPPAPKPPDEDTS